MSAALAETPSPIENHEHAGRCRHAGPGWFDSSWELRTGLQVKEGLPTDLPLHGWLEAWLQIAGGGAGGALALNAA
jgi:hypothetical protein